MKPEPLKWKIDDPNTYVENEDGSIDGIFHEKDIKSAVEWLKESLFDKIKSYNCDKINEYKLQEINEIINEAFEDVMKDG